MTKFSTPNFSFTGFYVYREISLNKLEMSQILKNETFKFYLFLNCIKKIECLNFIVV